MNPEVNHFFRKAMVARIATLSGTGRPSITPLYFVYVNGHIWLGTADWTLAAREAKADPRVSVLLQIERNPHHILRVTGSAQVKTDAETMRTSDLRMALKYVLTPRGLFDRLKHLNLIPALRQYRLQGKAKGRPCIIDVTPQQVELLTDT